MTNNQIANLLMVVLGIMFLVLFILIAIFVFLRIKAKQDQNRIEQKDKPSDKTKVQQLYSLQSIFKFMEFDKIEDNMIVEKKRKKVCNDN